MTVATTLGPTTYEKSQRLSVCLFVCLVRLPFYPSEHLSVCPQRFQDVVPRAPALRKRVTDVMQCAFGFRGCASDVGPRSRCDSMLLLSMAQLTVGYRDQDAALIGPEPVSPVSIGRNSTRVNSEAFKQRTEFTYAQQRCT